MTVVAFVGLGAMGMPMAKNLLNHQMTVRGADLNRDTLTELEQAGGYAASSVSDACMGADVLVLMVVNAAQARQVLEQKDALHQLKNDAVVVLMATCPTQEVEQLGAWVYSQGRRFVDAPVSGGVAGAKAASLTIMAAGEKSAFDDVEPIFDVLGKRVFYVGEKPGQGAMVKTVNQLLCGVHIAVMAEAFALADKVGVDLALLLEIMQGSSAASWMLNDRGSRMLQANPEVTSAVDIFVKDLGIVLKTGTDVRAALPIAAAAQQMFLAASGRGLAGADDSQVIRSYQVLNTTTSTH